MSKNDLMNHGWVCHNVWFWKHTLPRWQQKTPPLPDADSDEDTKKSGDEQCGESEEDEKSEDEEKDGASEKDEKSEDDEKDGESEEDEKKSQEEKKDSRSEDDEKSEDEKDGESEEDEKKSPEEKKDSRSEDDEKSEDEKDGESEEDEKKSQEKKDSESEDDEKSEDEKDGENEEDEKKSPEEKKDGRCEDDEKSEDEKNGESEEDEKKSEDEEKDGSSEDNPLLQIPAAQSLLKKGLAPEMLEVSKGSQSSNSSSSSTSSTSSASSSESNEEDEQPVMKRPAQRKKVTKSPPKGLEAAVEEASTLAAFDALHMTRYWDYCNGKFQHLTAQEALCELDVSESVEAPKIDPQKQYDKFLATVLQKKSESKRKVEEDMKEEPLEDLLDRDLEKEPRLPEPPTKRIRKKSSGI